MIFVHWTRNVPVSFVCLFCFVLLFFFPRNLVSGNLTLIRPNKDWLLKILADNIILWKHIRNLKVALNNLPDFYKDPSLSVKMHIFIEVIIQINTKGNVIKMLILTSFYFFTVCTLIFWGCFQVFPTFGSLMFNNDYVKQCLKLRLSSVF